MSGLCCGKEMGIAGAQFCVESRKTRLLDAPRLSACEQHPLWRQVAARISVPGFRTIGLGYGPRMSASRPSILARMNDKRLGISS